MKIYSFLWLMLFSFSSIWAQEPEKKTPKSSHKLWKVELLHTYDVLNMSYGFNYGFIAKGKFNFFNSKHLNLYCGMAHQYSYISESDNLFSDKVDGYTKDIGLYTVLDIVFYPFKKKTLYLSLEPFVGLTHLRSKGTLKMPHYGIVETYKNDYVYFNYGFTQGIGYTLGQFTIQASVWLSLKGFLDEGRSRPADFDSRFLIGLGASYSF